MKTNGDPVNHPAHYEDGPFAHAAPFWAALRARDPQAMLAALRDIPGGRHA